MIKENINFWEKYIDSYAEQSLDFINYVFNERVD